MKWTRHLCQLAVSSLATVALMPSWASDTTSLTPRRPRRELAQQRGPEHLGFGRPNIHTGNLAPTVTVDAARDDHRDPYDTAILAHLHVSGVDPQIRPVALDRTGEEGFTLSSISPRAGSPGSWRCQSHGLHQIVSERVETPCT